MCLEGAASCMLCCLWPRRRGGANRTMGVAHTSPKRAPGSERCLFTFRIVFCNQQNPQLSLWTLQNSLQNFMVRRRRSSRALPAGRSGARFSLPEDCLVGVLAKLPLKDR